MGARKGYDQKHGGKPSYQPILTSGFYYRDDADCQKHQCQCVISARKTLLLVGWQCAFRYQPEVRGHACTLSLCAN